VRVCILIQHAMRMSRTILSSVVSLALLYFPTLSHKQYDFLKKVIERKMCFDFLYKFCLKHISF